MADVLARLGGAASGADADRALLVLQRAAEDEPGLLVAAVEALSTSEFDVRTWERLSRILGPAGRRNPEIRARLLALARGASSPDKRAKAVALVARAEWPESPDLISEALAPGAATVVRAQAARSIATTIRLRRPKYEPALRRMATSSPTASVQREALSALISLPELGQESVDLVLRFATDATAPFSMRVAALAGLQVHGSMPQAETLRRAFAPESEDRRERMLRDQAMKAVQVIESRS